VFRAQFKNLEDGGPVLYAKITRPNGDARLTNVDGMIEIQFKRGEKLVVSHLTYDTLVIDPADYADAVMPVFYLTPRVYELREFKFTILGPRHLFDNKFVKNDMGKTDEEIVREKLEIADMRKELIGLDRGAQGGVVLGSPISALYNRFSKEGKELRKYAALIKQDRRDSAYVKEFQIETIMALTSFDLPTSKRFMEFCSFSKSYVTSVETLALYMEVLHCKDEYIEKDW
jgi:hypothetical protein